MKYLKENSLMWKELILPGKRHHLLIEHLLIQDLLKEESLPIPDRIQIREEMMCLQPESSLYAITLMNVLNLPDNKDRRVVQNQENLLQEVIPEVVDLIQELRLPAAAAHHTIAVEAQDHPVVLQGHQVEVQEVVAGLHPAEALGQVAGDKK